MPTKIAFQILGTWKFHLGSMDPRSHQNVSPAVKYFVMIIKFKYDGIFVDWNV